MTAFKTTLFRRLFTISAGASLLLGLAMAGLWVRSYRTAENLTLDRGDVLYLIFASRGEFCFQWTEQSEPRLDRAVFERLAFPVEDAVAPHGGVAWFTSTPTVMNRRLYQREVGVSFWLP